MQLPTALPTIAATPKRGPVAGWAPAKLVPGKSSRPDGLLDGGLHAWFRRPETGQGTPLTKVQVDVLAPFLAQRMRLAEDVVRGDLRNVRVLIGGLAAGAGNVATTIGTSIYVSDAAHAAYMLSWPGRTWLAHELAHTMQWRGASSEPLADTDRNRAFLNAYIGKYIVDEGKVGKGGLAQALQAWLESRRRDVSQDGIGDLIHDTHPMEREAAQVALAFRNATT